MRHLAHNRTSQNKPPLHSAPQDPTANRAPPCDTASVVGETKNGGSKGWEGDRQENAGGGPPAPCFPYKAHTRDGDNGHWLRWARQGGRGKARAGVRVWGGWGGGVGGKPQTKTPQNLPLPLPLAPPHSPTNQPPPRFLKIARYCFHGAGGGCGAKRATLGTIKQGTQWQGTAARGTHGPPNATGNSLPYTRTQPTQAVDTQQHHNKR